MTEAEAANGLRVGARPDISRSLRATYLSTDARWVDVFRILYGALLIAEILRRWLEIRLYYANDGVLPNYFALSRWGWQHWFSVFFASSNFSEINEFSSAYMQRVWQASGSLSGVEHVPAPLRATVNP